MAEWDAEHEVDEQRAQALIGAQFPELAGASVERLAEGWDNVVHLVGGRWVFRFPRRQIAIPGVEREIETLGRLAPNLPLPIPVPRFVGAAGDGYPWPWYGASYLPGVELAAAGLPDGDRGGLAAQLGEFLAAVHDRRLASRVGTGLPTDPTRRADMGTRVPATRRRVDELAEAGSWRPTAELEALLRDAASLPPASTTVLLHGDLHMRHLLVDERGAAAAVIDWGDVCVGDPSVDLSIAYGAFTGEPRRRLFEAYGTVPDGLAELRARVIAAFLAAALLQYADDQRLPALRTEAVASLDRAVN